MPSFTLRDISREAAARAAGINLNTLDVFVHRFDVGERVGNARLFSLRDLTTLVAARNLSGHGLSIGEAMRLVETLLHIEPDPDAVLIITANGDAWLQPKSAPWPETNLRLAYVGRVVSDLRRALNVAIRA